MAAEIAAEEILNSTVAKIVIVGAGQAGGRAAEALRAAGYAGSITMIGDEKHQPYERPQLSKQILNDRFSKVAYLRPSEGWSDVLDVQLVTGNAATDCDPQKRIVATQAGAEFGYDRLLIATGTTPRQIRTLKGTSAKVQYLRSIEDALSLREHLHSKARVVIIGGGVIGLEAASAAAKLGCEVTVVESQARLLARAFPKLISEFVEAKHRAHGVNFVFGATVTEGAPQGVRLDSGDELVADVVLIGIGVVPAATIAERMGLSSTDGIKVDALGRTSDENVFCAGDVALQWSECHQRTMRIETWANAQNQAASAAVNMIGVGREYLDPAWFWTDQYDLNIQVVGDPTPEDLVVRGDPASGKFSVVALRNGVMAGAIAINSAKDMAMFRRLSGRRLNVARSELESTTFDLRKALKTNS